MSLALLIIIYVCGYLFLMKYTNTHVKTCENFNKI